MTIVHGYVTDIIGGIPDQVTLELFLLYEVTPSGQAPTADGKVIVLPVAQPNIDALGYFVAEVPRNDETNPPSSLYEARFTASPRRTQTSIHFVADADDVDLSDPGVRVITPAPPSWAPLQGPPGADGQDGADVLYDTLPQTSPLAIGSGLRTWTKPGMGMHHGSAIPSSLLDLVVNAVYYEPFELYDEMSFDAMSVWIRTPRTGGLLSMSIYEANDGWQVGDRVLPTVDSAVFSTSAATLAIREFALTLPKGRYLTALRANINVGILYYYGITGTWGLALDSGDFKHVWSRYASAAFTPLDQWPDPGLPWTDHHLMNSWAGPLHRVLLRPAV